MELNIGDWVESYSPGIWQIYKNIKHKSNIMPSRRPKEMVIVFSKRFLTESFQYSVTEESCNSDLIVKLDNEKISKLNKFISENKALYDEFQQYQPRPIGVVYNARIAIPDNMSTTEVENMISKDRFFTDKDISPYLEELGFNTKKMPSWTIQFFCDDHECINDHLAYKFHRVLEF